MLTLHPVSLAAVRGAQSCCSFTLRTGLPSCYSRQVSRHINTRRPQKPREPLLRVLIPGGAAERIFPLTEQVNCRSCGYQAGGKGHACQCIPPGGLDLSLSSATTPSSILKLMTLVAGPWESRHIPCLSGPWSLVRLQTNPPLSEPTYLLPASEASILRGQASRTPPLLSLLTA